MNDAMAADPKVLALGEEVGDKQEGGVMGVTKGLSTRFGDDRVKPTPISEQSIFGAAVGAAVGGYRPVAEIMFMNFVTVTIDLMNNHAAKLRFSSVGQNTVLLFIRKMPRAGSGIVVKSSDSLQGSFANTKRLKAF